jgi:hypothetical protein
VSIAHAQSTTKPPGSGQGDPKGHHAAATHSQRVRERIDAMPRVQGRRPERLRALGSEHVLLDALHADPRWKEQTRSMRRALEHACFFWADGHGSFTAQVRRWADAVDVHPDTLRAGIRQAVSSGLLERAAFFGQSGRQGANEYRVAALPAARRGRSATTPEKTVNKGVANPPPRNVRTLGGGEDEQRPRGVPVVTHHPTPKPHSESSTTAPAPVGELWGWADTPRPLAAPGRSVTRPAPWRVTPSATEKAERVEAALRARCRVVRPRTRPGHVASFEVTCPLSGRHAHGDRHPSAAVSVTDDGTIKLACGVCGHGRESEYWREAMLALGLPPMLAFHDGYEIDATALPTRRRRSSSSGRRAGGRAARSSAPPDVSPQATAPRDAQL